MFLGVREWGMESGVNFKKNMIRLYHSILSISIYDLIVSEMPFFIKKKPKTKKDKNAGVNIF